MNTFCKEVPPLKPDHLAALEILEAQAPALCALSDAVWDTPETAFGEQRSADALCRALADYGFAVTRPLAGIDTAFCGRFGSGKPVIGILGEFDALSGLSQTADLPQKQPLVPDGAGHGCGHNLLGVGSLGAALAIKDYLQRQKCPGTVIYYGCPGEEGGSGKAFMARDGVFDELDCALTWHPWDINAASNETSLANYQVSYRFRGISSHAAATPELGRSALDAVELMNVGVQFLREHIIQDARIHYAITNSGGFSPNVVQPFAEVLYLIRAPKNQQLEEIYRRVNKIAQGAALMTETELEIDFVKACSNMVVNPPLVRLLQQSLEALPPPQYTDAERAYAQSMIDTFESPANPYLAALGRYTPDDAQRLRAHFGQPLFDFVAPAAAHESQMGGSTDVGDVSWVCPTAQLYTVTKAALTPAHSWQQTAQGKSSIAHKGMLYAARVLAGAAMQLFEDPALLAEAKKAHAQQLDGSIYRSAIPPQVRPRRIDPGSR